MNFEEKETKILTMTKGPDNCINIFMPNVFDEKYKKKIDDLKINKRKKNRFSRNFMNSVDNCKIDANWRVKLPDELVEYAQIDKEVLILGMNDKIELWNPGRFKEYLAQDETDEEDYDFNDFTTDIFVD